MKNYALTTLGTLSAVLLLPLAACSQLKTPENVPITFYGKVVDQQSQPLPGATVTFDLVTSHIRRLETSAKPVTLKTGPNGHFTLSGVTGYAINGVSVSVDGYELSKKAPRSFTFGLMPTYTPDPVNPVIFRMWKLAGKEQLVHSSWRGKVACDGTTNIFDLVTGHSSTDGILKIICTRTPLSYEPVSHTPYDYKFEMSLAGGGIQSADDEFTYLAPAGGYEPTLVIERKSGDPKWVGNIRQNFYIKTKEGHFGCIYVQWEAAHQPSPTILEWSFTYNPSGSRNLER